MAYKINLVNEFAAFCRFSTLTVPIRINLFSNYSVTDNAI